MRKSMAVTALAIVSLMLFAGAKRRAAAPPLPLPPINFRRSLIVTDQIILQTFTFRRVLDQLVARSGVPGLTSAQLYRQMFDTQNPKPGLFDPTAPHCDDFLIDGKPTFNGIPRRCPTPEGALAASPYASDEYFPLAIVNRFDLSPPDGSNCGQYRMVFARKVATPTEKLHLIFEAVLPNPHPERGLNGCRDAALFWANLGSVSSAAERRDRLEQFFFTGVAGYAPVVDPPNYDGSANQSGVRALEFGTATNRARFYQFRLTKSCAAGQCTLRMTPDVLEDQPFGPYFDGHNTSAVARAFRDSFVTQAASLAVNDANLFQMHIPTDYLMAESDPVVDNPTVADGVAGFNRGLGTPDGDDFKARMDAELQRAGSTLTAKQLLFRATMRGCIGCHLGLPPGIADANGDPILQQFPTNFGFQMFDESKVSDGPDGPQYALGTVLGITFLPHRATILRNFLVSGTPPVHSN